MSNIIEIQIPNIGDFSDVPVIEIAVAAGDRVAVDDTLIVLESDKATLDVPSPAAGKIIELKVAVDDHVSSGSVIGLLEPDQAEAGSVGAKNSAPAGATTTASSSDPEQALPQPSIATTETANAVVPASESSSTPPQRRDSSTLAYATPSIRRFARQLGVVIDEVNGTGPNKRIIREDVEAFVKAKISGAPAGAGSKASVDGLPQWPNIDFASFGPIERVPLSRITKISGPALARNAMVIPHVTNFENSDVTELESFRKLMNTEAETEDARITMLAFAVKAVVSALKAFPAFNSSLDGDELIVKSYWNIGVAANTADGLVVPVVKSADSKGVREIANEMASLAELARDGKLKAGDMQGATFTISSLGGIGSTNFTPIINAPEVAILGISRAQIQPVWDGSAFEPRLILPLSLSFDHRAVDGAAAARFLSHVADVLSDFRRISN